MYELSSARGHSGSTKFEGKSSYCRVARLGFRRRTTAVLKSNSIEFGTAVARRLKRACMFHCIVFRLSPPPPPPPPPPPHDKPQSLETAAIMYDRTLRLSIQRKTSIVLRVGIDKVITGLTYHPWRIKAI